VPLEKKDKNFLDRAKVFAFQLLEKNAFIVVLIGASIPNPLFDLAGLACGHFLVPFFTFFGATMIGKAVIKVSIQSFFIITIFNKRNF